MELFYTREASDNNDIITNISSKTVKELSSSESSRKQGTIVNNTNHLSHTFNELGICKWLCQSTISMGFKHPTEIQSACIPAILSGRSVIGCAETGSGKTAAFGLPILQHLSEDAYGIFAIILTPTRELAIQINEQFAAFGANIGLKLALIIGGVSMTEQSLLLSNLPHIVIATPGIASLLYYLYSWKRNRHNYDLSVDLQVD